MNIKVKKFLNLLFVLLVLALIVGLFAKTLLSSKEESPELSLPTGPSEEVVLETEPVETVAPLVEMEQWQETYDLICEFIDQGDAKSAVTALLEDPAAESIYAHFNAEDPALLEIVIMEAACFYHEDGDLHNIVDLRLRGFFSNEMFLKYWEHNGMDTSFVNNDTNDYDVYLFQEIMNWYAWGGETLAKIVDLRALGMIDDALYAALVAEWGMDLMDNVDLDKYIPLYGMQLSEDEKGLIKSWQAYVDEGNSRGIAQMFLEGDMTENVYRWLQKNDGNLVDMVLAQAMFEFAQAGDYEQNIRLILSDHVSDDCFMQYWNLVEFVPEDNNRVSEVYQNVDMYFVYEMERICRIENDAYLVQSLWNSKIIDEDTYDLLIGRVGGWESNAWETEIG